MCQLCTITTIVNNLRWPTPLQPLVTDIKDLVPTAHAEALAYQAASKAARSKGENPTPCSSAKPSSSINEPEDGVSQTSPSPGREPKRSSISITKAPQADITLPLKRTFQLLSLQLDALERARCDWFHSPAKVAQRRQWAEIGDVAKCQASQVINNKCDDAIEAARGSMGRFLKWVVGFEDGVKAFYEELEVEMREKK